MPNKYLMKKQMTKWLNKLEKMWQMAHWVFDFQKKSFGLLVASKQYEAQSLIINCISYPQMHFKHTHTLLRHKTCGYMSE